MPTASRAGRRTTIRRTATTLRAAVAATAGLLLLPLLLVAYLFARLVEELSGQGAWHRRQRRIMADGRPPLADVEFLRGERARPDDAPLWLAVRLAMAGSIGVPPGAVRPQDRLADLWRMQRLGPDLMDIVFRVERSLGVRITREALDQAFRGDWTGEFRQFAARFVGMLRGLPRAGAVRRASDRSGP